MDVHYVHSPAPYSVEENFEGCFHGQDDLTLAQLLQDQETVYQSLQRNAQNDSIRTPTIIPRGNTNDRRQSDGNSYKSLDAESQLAVDEAYARELQELENQFTLASINRTPGIENDATRAESSSSSTLSSRQNSFSNALTQVARQDDVDTDNMTYEELQSLGEAIGTHNRGISDELISYLPVSIYKTGLFPRRDKKEQCVICYMTYKNRDKLIILPCLHQYHKGCVTKWLKINKACPVCNEEVFGS